DLTEGGGAEGDRSDDLAGVDPTVGVPVLPRDEVQNLELVGAGDPARLTVPDVERPGMVGQIELVLLGRGPQVARDVELVSNGAHCDGPLGRRFEVVRDPVAIRIGGPFGDRQGRSEDHGQSGGRGERYRGGAGENQGTTSSDSMGVGRYKEVILQFSKPSTCVDGEDPARGCRSPRPGFLWHPAASVLG